MEKKIQVERENEKDSFKDKEMFVTSAYKKKMLEMQEAEEQERKQAALEGDSVNCLLFYLYNLLLAYNDAAFVHNLTDVCNVDS